MVGTFLGRTYSIEHGHFNLQPNLYVMLIGAPGARKSTAIKIAKSIITGAGYKSVSADRSSKEKFLLDLAGEDLYTGDNKQIETDLLDRNLWGDDAGGVNEMYIACDEFNDFIGTGNVEFISMLGSLWDYNGVYTNRIKTGKSVSIKDPTISILGGNTPTNFIRAFPPEILGQGFFSRLLLIHGDPSGRKITFPKKPSIEATNTLIGSLQRLKVSSVGTAKLSRDAEALLDKIYQTDKGLEDVRFESYSQRRFSHLVKLSLITSACDYACTIEARHVVEANTILTHTEKFMPAAMGEFGKSKNSDITHKVMQVLNTAYDPMKVSDLWVHVHKDLEKINELGDILRNLVTANRIITVNGGFLARRALVEEVSNDMLNYDYLTDEERGMKT
jgi:hypothetical protein